MRTLLSAFLCMLVATSTTFAQQINPGSAKSIPIEAVPDFDNMSDVQIQEWENSVVEKLYPQPTIGSIQAPNAKTLKVARNARLKSAPLSMTNIPPPAKDAPLSVINIRGYYPIDKTKGVGEIPVTSSVTPTGAVTYSVPIEVSPGKQGAHPQLSLMYNSLASNGIMGVGWSIGGLSFISRVAKSIYYDKKAQGVTLTQNDAFVLDGVRLIKLSETSTQIEYETEQGQIKVKAILNRGVIRYFEVRYPNGNKSTMGYTSNYSNLLSYPLTASTDLRGNTVTYSYIRSNNRYFVNSISYTGGSVSFFYGARQDPVISYNGGLKVTENQLLQRIECKSNGTTFRTYELSYQTAQPPQHVSMLKEIECTASGKSLNPLRFYYGTGSSADSFVKEETQLQSWYTNAEPGQLILRKGKFDYGTDNDGLISLPNKNPYWEHFRNKTWFRKRQNRYENHYNGTEKIYLYTGLDADLAMPMPDLTTEAGFIDIFAADIDGKYEEELIKVNNTVCWENNKCNDRLQFKVYFGNLYSGLHLQYTRTFNFDTTLTDSDGATSIHPKFHFPGDFNGDGKMEILSVSNDHPFGWTDRPTHCYLFDLESDTTYYEGTPFAFYKRFAANNFPYPEAAAQNSDRLFVFDFDGDGKTDICLINDNGTYFYTFDVNGSSYSVREVSFYAALKKSTLEGRELRIGEFNGDGKPDFLLSPKVGASDWAIYYAMGNGQFECVATSISIMTRTKDDDFILQDVNSDGLTDVLKIWTNKRSNTSGFHTCLAKLGTTGTTFSYNYNSSASINSASVAFVSTDINSHHSFNKLVALKDGKVTRYSYPRNDTKERQLTGSINSLGVVTENHYMLLNEEDRYEFNPCFTQGYGALEPYKNFKGPLSVAVSREQYLNGQRNEHFGYRYENAVIHKQGRGFCGFGKVTIADYVRGQYSTQEFDPYNFGVLKSMESPTGKTTNTWSISVQSDKIAKIKLTNISSLDKLTNQTVTSTNVYDAYGNVTKETIDYGGGITKVTDQSYYNSSSETIYMLGQPIRKTVTNKRAGSSWVDKETYTFNEKRLPLTKISYTGTDGAYKVEETRWTYDSNWNVVSEKSAPYGYVTASLEKAYTYDSSGRFLATATNTLGQTTTYSNYDAYGNPKTIRDYKNRITTHNYDVWGRLISTSYPDGTTESTALAWGGKGLFTVTKTATGQPTTVVHNDALGREVRSGNMRFDGQWQYTDTEYNARGQVSRTSLPFKGTSATQWNSYTYGSYDRLTRLTLASGKYSTWSYSGLSSTETKNGIATTTTKDSSGMTVSVSDPGGTIAYTLRPDGQPSTTTAPGNIVTSFEYDVYGRQTAIVDPSAGRQTTAYSYTTAGVLTLTKTNPKGTNISVFDKYGRVTSRQRQGEFTTTYEYNTDGLLASETSTNGTAKTYAYDTYDRIATEKEIVPDGKWLQKTYSYSSGNISSIQYSAQSGILGTESFIYAHGHNTEITLNGSTSIWKLTAENALGQPTAAMTGTMSRSYSYDSFGIPTGRTAGSIQEFAYSFDIQKGNLLSRTDNKYSKTESFSYDNLNRLTSAGGKAISYADNGNITRIEGVGSMTYGNTAKPYQMTMLSAEGSAVPMRNQNVSYTSFQRPSRIEENGTSASFTYNAQGARVKMHVANGTSQVLTRYYIGGQYELDAPSNTERLYLAGDAYSSPVVLVKESGSWNLYYICRDYLGSITHIANADGSLKQELSYDAWGRLRNPSTQAVYAPGSEPALLLGRGYTGHEHLTWFGLINMNARLYDPALGRFLSPDPYVQAPDSTQNYNRYSYCVNNPLKYTDLTGEWFGIDDLIGFLIGGTINLISNAIQGNIHSFGDGLAAFGAGGAAGTLALYGPAGWVAGGAIVGGTNAWLGGATGWDIVKGAGIGAISGLAGGAAGQWATSALSPALSSISSPVLQGAATGVVGGGVGGFAGGFTGGLLMTGDLRQAFNSGLQGTAIGMGIGGAVGAGYGYKNAIENNRNPWTGKPNTVEAPQPQQTPYQKGLEGVNRAEQDIISQGGTPIAREVTLDVGDVRVRVDMAAKINNEVHFIEVKNGPSAGFTPNQKIAYPQMTDGVRIPVIPRGTNAIPLGRYGMPVGQPTTGYRFRTIKY